MSTSGTLRGHLHAIPGRNGTFDPMTDASVDLANAQAALASQGPPKMRVLRAVHKGLVELPDEMPSPGWDPEIDAKPIVVRRVSA